MPSGAIEPLMLVPVRAELERDVLRPPVRRVLDEVARAPVLLERLFVLLPLLRLAVPRFAVLRLAVLRLAVLRFAVLRFAVLRLAVLRFAVLRFAVLRLAVLRFAAPLERLVVRRFVVLRRLVPPLERVLDPLDLLLAVAICSLLVGDVGGNADLCSMRAASADIQQNEHLSYFEMSSTRFPVCSSDAFRAMSAWATMPTSLPSSSTTGKRRT
jgi:hypothetical protein